MAKRDITTEISIAAPPLDIWNKLMDFEQYPEWNPFIRSIQGKREQGQQLTVVIQPPDSKAMTFKPEILVHDQGKEFRWLGKAGIKGIFDGEHFFQLEPQANGQTKLVHGEKFSGLLVGLMKKTLDKTKDGFELMNEALKRECERKNELS